MTKYTKPEMTIEELDAKDVIATSSEDLNVWGSNQKTVDSKDVINVFE